MSKLTALLTLALMLVFVAVSFGQAQESALRPFDGIYTFGWIGNDRQKELDVKSCDFLVEFKVNADKITRSGMPEMGILSKKPFGNQPGYCFAASQSGELAIILNDVQREKLGKGDYRFVLGGHFKSGAWVHTAILYDRSKKQVTVFADGKAVKSFPNVTLDDLTNWADFTIGTANLPNLERFKGAIEYAGVWKFSPKAPANVQDLVAKLAASGNRAELLAPAGARGSFWKLAKSDKGAEDLGNIGNFLYYMPENEKLRFEAMEKTFKPESAKTIFVDMNHPAAADEGEGSAEKPFKTLQRAVSFASAGDTVKVRQGAYRETIEASGGRPGAPIRLVSEDKEVVLSGGDVLRDWKKADAEGVYVLRGWQGAYLGPMDEKEYDARKNPNSIVFVNNAPLEWVEYVEDLVPGTHTIWPRVKHQPMDIYIFPSPEETPSNATVEINVNRGVNLLDFIEIEGFTVSKMGLGLGGRGCLARNNLIEWGGMGFGGAEHKMIGNRIIWSGHTGLGSGAASNCLFEGNTVAYANWRVFEPGWHGGGAKLIPANIDLTIRANVFRQNWGAGFWFDAYNAGNLVERNLCCDNSGAALFDEISWGNTIQYNIIYNTWCVRQNRSGGRGLSIGETSDDDVYRNIVFNDERGDGIFIRGYYSREASGSPEAVLANNIKYPHHYVPSERQRKWLGESIKFYQEKNVLQVDNKIRENISFWHHTGQFWTQRDYRVKNDPRDQFYEFQSDGNIYFNTDPNKIIKMGDETLSLEKWREISSKDKNSRVIDPYNETDKLPQWARDMLDFSKHKFRPAYEIAQLRPEIRDGIGSIIFKSRIARAADYRKVMVTDPALRVFYLETEGEKMLALWRTFGVGQVRVKNAPSNLILEDRWLRRKPLGGEQGQVRFLVGPEPVYLVNISDQTSIDPAFKGKLYGTAKEVVIPSTQAKLKIDGNLADWQTIQASGTFAEFAAERDVIPDSPRKWEGPKDCSAKVYAAWDKAGLYFAFDVTNDSVTAADSVELFIDGREEWQQFFSEYQPCVYHLKLESAGGNLKISTPPLVAVSQYARKKAEPAGVEGACAVSPNGYTIELFIPWNKKNFPTETLEKDTILRVGILLNDGDQGKTGAVTMKWNANRSNINFTSGWLPVAIH